MMKGIRSVREQFDHLSELQKVSKLDASQHSTVIQIIWHPLLCAFTTFQICGKRANVFDKLLCPEDWEDMLSTGFQVRVPTAISGYRVVRLEFKKIQGKGETRFGMSFL